MNDNESFLNIIIKYGWRNQIYHKAILVLLKLITPPYWITSQYSLFLNYSNNEHHFILHVFVNIRLSINCINQE